MKEKYISREKVTIEMFEEKLIASLKEIGVDPGNLSLTDANADYVKVRWQTKDVLTRKDYSLKISSTLILSKVFQQLSKLEVDDADVYKVSYSKIDSLNKSVRIAAIKNAKDRADYFFLVYPLGQTGFTATTFLVVLPLTQVIVFKLLIICCS